MLQAVERQGKVKFLTAKGQEMLIENEPNLKYKFLWAVLFDAGLRTTEARFLKWKDFDWAKRLISVKTLKQKGEKAGKIRLVPITERIFDLASEFYKGLEKRPNENDYVFTSKQFPDKPISRQQIDRNLKDIIPGISAHTLRHTFGAKLASENTPVETSAKLLGHSGTQVTFEFYYHIEERILRQAVQRTEPKNWARDVWYFFFPKRKVHIQPMTEGLTKFHVGRKAELLQLQELTEKKVNTLLLGEQGLGKSHLLQNLNIEKVLRADEVSNPKKFVGGMLLILHQGHEDENGNYIVGKEAALALVTKNADLRRYIQAESLGNLVETLLQVCSPREYTLVIDNVSQLTPSGLKV
ncbi:MAG: site-specific integrase, partial [Bacteroidota bacterium]